MFLKFDSQRTWLSMRSHLKSMLMASPCRCRPGNLVQYLYSLCRLLASMIGTHIQVADAGVGV